MKLGFDLDGVLADYVTGLQAAFINTSGRDLFRSDDAPFPPTWDWFRDRGYTQEEVDGAMAVVTTCSDFWFALGPVPELEQLPHVFDELSEAHEVYFITQREGPKVKMQTEEWLGYFLGLHRVPSVLIVGSRMKGFAAKALQLDAYIDDNFDNCADVMKDSPLTRTYLLNRRYNEDHSVVHRRWLNSYLDIIQRVEGRRIYSVGEFLRCENLIPYTTGVASTP